MVLKNQRPDFDIYNCGSPKIEKKKKKSNYLARKTANSLTVL
jgi:hypothetical protein